MRLRVCCAAVLAVVWFAGCNQEIAVGVERGACYRNNTCNAGLVCLSQLCVRIPESGLPFDARPERPRAPDLPFQPPPPGWDGFGPQPPPPRWDGFGPQPPPPGGDGKKLKDAKPPPPADLGPADKRSPDAPQG